MITFANGALGQWINHHAGHGEPPQPPDGLRHARLDRRPRRPQRPPGPAHPRRRHGRSTTGASSTTRRATASTRWRRTLFGGERVWTYDFDFPDDRPQAARARVPRVRRVRPHRRDARSRRRGGAARRRPRLRPVRVADRRPRGHDRRESNRARSTPTSARSISITVYCQRRVLIEHDGSFLNDRTPETARTKAAAAGTKVACGQTRRLPHGKRSFDSAQDDGKGMTEKR